MRVWPITPWRWISLGAITLAALVSLAEPAQAEARYPPRIEVFTDHTRPVHIPAGLGETLQAQGIVVKVFELDAPARLEEQLSADLPADPVQAEHIARQRLEAIGLEQLNGQLAEACQGLLLALEYGIDRYPAIVFDGGVGVVYGITDLAQALKHYRRWQGKGSGP